jgi:tetratricopeptide (TPR) repeat protein
MSAAPRTTTTGRESDAERQAADLAAFRRMLEISSGTFSLSFAVCDDRKLRDSLVERFSAEFPGIAIVRLPAGVEGIYTTAATQIGSQTPAAIFVLDLEASIPFGSDSQPALRVLNSSREHWEAFRCPVVFWLAEYAITLLYRHAPDLWRYRSHQFEFVPEAVPLTDLKTESFSGFPMVDAMPYEEKAFRIAELERRVREAGDPPPADLLPHVLTWIYELAHLYQHASRFPEAESILRKAVVYSESTYGTNHPVTGNSLGNLSELLRATHRMAEAESLMRRALGIDEASNGPDHPKVAIRLNNLAGLLHSINQLVDAEPLMRRALDIDELSNGPDHPAVARTLNNLAGLLQDTNRIAEAEPLIRRALSIDVSYYGPNHPAVARDLNNLALLLKATNRLVEVESLMRRALKIDEASYGPGHPDVAIDLNNLALLLKTTKRMTEAEPLMQRVVEIFQTSYGKDHPNVATGLSNLAALLQATNRLAEAEPLMRRALGIFVRSLGLEHPNSQTVRRNYIGLLKALKVPEEEIEERVRSVMSGAQGSSA